MWTLVALCLAGLESVVAEDIRSRLSSDPQLTVRVLSGAVAMGDSACGKILVECSVLPQAVHSIRSVQAWLLYLLHEPKVASTLEGAVEQVTSGLAIVDLGHTYDQWRQIMESAGQATPEAPKFCARCIRDGDHKFNSVDMARRVGEAVVQKTSWTVSLKEMDVEALCIVHNEMLVLGLLLPIGCRPAFKSKLPSECRPPAVPSTVSPSLRPSTAYLMVKLADPQPFDILLDGMCGSGTILVEAAYGHGCIGIGGDADPKVSDKLREALQATRDMSSARAVAEAMLWSSKRLPVVDASIDIAIIDLPFSKLGNNVPNYQRPRPGQTVSELARALAPSRGRCVLLTQTHQQLYNCLNSIYFDDIQIYPVNIGGYVCSILTARRTAEAFVRHHVIQHLEQGEDGRTTLPKKRPASEL